MAKLKKEDLVAILANSMTDEQWDWIAKLRGQPVPPTPKKKENCLNGLFRRTVSHGRAKSKARSLQQWACAKIGEFAGLPWGKDEEVASREMGQSGPDVRLSANARNLFPFTLECKSGNRWDVQGAIKQCQANLYPYTDWMVVLDRSDPRPEKRIPPVVAVDGELFFKILKKADVLDSSWRQALKSQLAKGEKE